MTTRSPKGELLIRVMAMPADTNGHGEMFGGWILSQMDLGGASLATERTRTRVVTVAIDKMAFLYPVEVGDIMSCYGTLQRIGNTSITVAIETWVSSRFDEKKMHCVTEGLFTYVAIDAQGKPISIAIQ